MSQAPRVLSYTQRILCDGLSPNPSEKVHRLYPPSIVQTQFGDTLNRCSRRFQVVSWPNLTLSHTQTGYTLEPCTRRFQVVSWPNLTQPDRITHANRIHAQTVTPAQMFVASICQTSVTTFYLSTRKVMFDTMVSTTYINELKPWNPIVLFTWLDNDPVSTVCELVIFVICCNSCWSLRRMRTSDEDGIYFNSHERPC